MKLLFNLIFFIYNRSWFILLLFIGNSVLSQNLKNNLNRKQEFKLLWKTYVGQTTFRTTLLRYGKWIIVPSNGESRSSMSDSKDGIYLIDSFSGKVERVIQDKSSLLPRDTDINGIAVYQNTIFFGNDNNEFFSYSLDQKSSGWTLKTTGDIESAPALTDLNLDSYPDVVFTTEAGEVYAVDGKNGEVIWKYLSTWNKEDVNLSSKAFIASPALYDINKDGIRDVLIGSRNGTFYSIDGASGQLLWRKKVFSGIHSSAIVNNYDSEKVTILVSESYGEIHTLNLAGGVSSSQRTSIGLFSSPIICQGGQIVAATSWFGDDDDGYCVITNENTQDRECKITGKISASPLYGDVLPWIYPNVILVTENGKMYVLENDGNQLVGDFDLPAGVEATPIITDVNNNGVNDILIAARDGFLYAYETKGDGKVIWGQFRGNNFNTGVLIDEEAETSFIPTKQMSVKGKLKSSSNLGGIEVSGRKKAIVIGISDYSNLESVTNVNSNVSLTDLQYADNDANSFAEFLETSEISGGNWDITLLTEEKATRARIMSAIDEVMTSSRPEDLIYLFFSGHGRQGPNDGSEIYFMTRDSDFKDGYSGVSYDWIKDKMSNSKADHIVFFVDACRSGVIGYNKGTGAFDNQMLQLRSTKPNKVIFSSGRGNQLAFEDNGFKHGIFTYFLLSGLKGAAPEIRRDNYLDLEELGEYVENQVRIYTRRNPKTTTQVPVIWTKEGFIAEGFPIAIRR